MQYCYFEIHQCSVYLGFVVFFPYLSSISLNGLLGCFQLLAVPNKAVMNICAEETQGLREEAAGELGLSEGQQKLTEKEKKSRGHLPPENDTSRTRSQLMLPASPSLG